MNEYNTEVSCQYWTHTYEAAAGKFADFEDTALYEGACHAGVNYIVTRNIADFKVTGA
jgi:hypothetical protein